VEIVDGAAIDSVLGTELKPEHETLFSSEDLTIQRIIWLPGLGSSLHEHRMWAVVGVYAGEELNRIYERAPDGLTDRGTRTVPERDVFVLDADAIHSVENPDRNWTAGIHVYGGDIVNIERSAWVLTAARSRSPRTPVREGRCSGRCVSLRRSTE